MYIVNDICYADTKEEDIRVVDAKALKGQMLLATFASGEKKLFDVSKLTGTAFEPLKDEKIFSDISIFHGVITWNGGDIDIAPETVYYDGYEYNEMR